MDRLAGRVALVTGAGQGIGRGIALVFAREGARVCVAELKEHRAERTAQEIRAAGGGPRPRTKRGQDYAARDPEGFAKAMAARPIGRLGDPETDIAPVALFLATDDSRFVTGHVFYVDGGAHLG